MRPDWTSRLGALRSPRRVAGALLRRGRRLRQVALRRVLPDRRFAWSPTDFRAALRGRASSADEPPPAAVVQFLEDRSADRVPHAVASYQEHLLGTYRILATWNQPEEICGAGLLHSVYSTDSYRHALLAPTERATVRGLLGPYAEELVFLYATVDKVDLRRKLKRLSHLPPAGLDLVNHRTGQRRRLGARLLGQFLVILVADHADQFCTPSGAPRLWLADYARLLRLSRGALDPVPPVFGQCTAGLSLEEEQRARDLYVRATDEIASAPRLAHAHLAECHRLNPGWRSPWSCWRSSISRRAGTRRRAKKLTRRCACSTRGRPPGTSGAAGQPGDRRRNR